MVDHVHFHVIPKPSAGDEEGLVLGWPAKQTSPEDLTELQEEITGKL
jgi:diadenosine tetraphosphate (Ap4A) HIT family hydrolase